MELTDQCPTAEASDTFLGDLECLGELRDSLREFCAKTPAAELPRRWMFQLELALNEAATNVIRHALHNDTSRSFEVQLAAFGQAVRIRLLHQGAGFDREKVPPPTSDGSMTGGFGVFLIDQCVDRVHYGEQPGGGQLVELVKRFDSQPDEDDS